jgi:hypothetical protein
LTLRYELEPFASTGREAARIVDELFNNIIAAPRRDRRLAEIRLQELELIFADPRADAEQRLFDGLRDRVHPDDVDTVDGVEG